MPNRLATEMQRLLFPLVALVLITLTVMYGSFLFSPWPGVLRFRRGSERQAIHLVSKLEKYVPDGIAAKLNQRYDVEDANALFDAFYPANIEYTDQLLPTIVWVHGGSWISGSKDDIANYLKILASKGFTTIGVNYTLAPEKTYPSPVIQVNEALAFIAKNSRRFHADPSKVFLAGDSAGSQIAAQLANVISLPSYAEKVGVTPSIQRSQLRGVILHCGVYDAELTKYSRAGVLWAYFGTQDFLKDPRIKQFSVAHSITADFPPIFISSGNDDALAPHSHLFAAIATKNGIPVDSLFFPEDYKPPMQHEFQFDLDTEEARLALDRSVKFVLAQIK
jgi:acetyl esterase